MTPVGTVKVCTAPVDVNVTVQVPSAQTGSGALGAAEAVPDEADQSREELVARTSRESPPWPSRRRRRVGVELN
ncbi:hypothetical protein GCM10022197_13480 [Microlunatus spumicola]|uniref:Uncharacterized protein n=1 Tax=Microlunatus spumicola TaxID=81499 RepID=A0ABP6X011_9ACTN